MATKRKQKKSNQRGVSLVESMIAVTVVTMTIVGAGMIIAQQSNMIQEAEEKIETLGAEIEILSRSVRLLTEVAVPVDANNPALGTTHTGGLCKLVHTDALDYGVNQVYLDFATNKLTDPNISELNILIFETYLCRISYMLTFS